MTWPAAVTSHHTAWVSVSGSTAHPVRYAVDGNRLVCFGDETLVDVPDNARVSVSIHEISGGHLLATFGASLHRLSPDAITMNALIELLDHVPLGRSLGEVEAHLDDERAHRRVVELIP
jgi:hypothetical protein